MWQWQGGGRGAAAGRPGGRSGRRSASRWRDYIRAQHPELRDPERRSAADHRAQRRDGAGRDRRQLRREPCGAGPLARRRGRREGRAGAHSARSGAQALRDRAVAASPSTPATRSATSRSAGATWCWPRSMARPSCATREGGRRYATIADFRNFVKLGYMSKWLHHSGGTVCEPTDVPVNKRHLDMLLAHMTLSRQALHGVGHRTQPRRRIRSRCAKILFGADFVDQNTVMTSLININSPADLRRHHDGRARGLCRAPIRPRSSAPSSSAARWPR